MGVNKDNGVRTGSMTGGSSQVKVIEAAGTAVRYRWQTGVIAVQVDVAGTCLLACARRQKSLMLWLTQSNGS